MRARSGRGGTSLAIGVALVAVAQLFAPTAVARAASGPLASKPATSTRREQALADYAKLPIAFEPNVGQAAKGISYVARGDGFGLALSPGGLAMAFRPEAQVPSPPSGRPHYVHSTPADAAILSMAFPGAASAPALVAGDKLPGTVNYLLGPNSKSWHRHVPTYARVTYRALYPGIDLEFSGAGGKLEYTYTLAAGSDPGVIRLAFSGQDVLSVDAAGNLVATVKAETLTQPPPVAYQTVGSERRSVPSRYLLLDAKTVGFQLGDYDHNLPLTIDPVLVYSTYLGGSSNDIALGLAVDASGNAYITGYTFSTDFPTTTGVYQKTNKGSYDVFVSKLDPTGSTLLYSTYIGGTKDDEAGAIAVESSTGRVFITGVTDSAAYPTTTGAYQKTFKGGVWDAFFTKLNIYGSSLTYSTYIGGTADDEALGVTLDTAASKAMIAGLTSSTNYPTTASAYQKTNKGSYDAFVTKIDPNPNVALVFSTYLGGTGDDEALGIVRGDTADREFVVGLTSSTAFPTTTGAFQTTNKGGYDAFFVKMNKLGSTLNYSTYLGGTSDDFGVAVTADAAGMGYLTGETLSTNFPTTAGVFQSTGHGDDAFATKVNPNSGVALPYSTYLGGSATDVGRAITLDSDTNAYVVGSTVSTDFPTAGNPIQSKLSGGADAFATEVNTTAAAMTYSTYLGAASDEEADAVAGASSGAVYLGGFSISPGFPTAGRPFQEAKSLGYDAFVAKISPGTPIGVFEDYDGFRPPAVTALQGSNVQWALQSFDTKNGVVDASGMALFGSGDRESGSVYAFTFVAAGTYAVTGGTYQMSSVTVPLTASPGVGNLSTSFLIVWASGSLPSGFASDIQIERPGDTTFSDWLTGTASLSAPFVPDAGIGLYSFQARVRNTSTGAASGYSPVVSVFAAGGSVSDAGFDPTLETVPVGAPFQWAFPSTNVQSHTASDASGMGLFDSGPVAPGGSYTFALFGAGTYSVIDSTSGHSSSIAVTVSASPSSGDPTAPFAISWASTPAPTGYVYDVQIERPGSPTFQDWQPGVTTAGISFVPDAGLGIYSFQARVRQLSSGLSTGYSGSTSITTVGWNQFGDTPDHLRFNPVENVIDASNVATLTQSWAAYILGSGFIGEPVVANGTIYDKTPYYVAAFDATTGYAIWKVPSSHFGDPQTLALSDGILYSAEGNLYALDPSDGATLWTVSRATSFTSSPVVANGVLYAVYGTTLEAFDAKSGASIWTASATQSIRSTPAVANGVVYVGSDDKNLYAFDAATGALKWKKLTNGIVFSSPAVANGLVYVGSEDKNVYAFRAATGKRIWSVTTGAAVDASSAVANGIVYVGSTDKKLYAINAATGALLWTMTMGGAPSSASVANGVVYVAGFDSKVYAANASGCGVATCSPLWTFKLDVPLGLAPVVIDGRVMVTGSVIQAFELP